MRFIYNFVLHLLIPFLLFRLYWKGRRLTAYRHRIAERFSLGNASSLPIDAWVHANSLGEVIAATPLIDALLDKQWRVLVTTMTPTGSHQVKTRFGHQVEHHYVPYDLSWAVRRFYKRIKPRIGIIMETELWPNLIHQARVAKIPLVIANARLSDKSFKSYQKIRFFIKPVIEQLTAILAQSELDAKRFIALGGSERRVHMLGNMKFDLQARVANSQAVESLKMAWGAQRPVIIAASTHDDEENQLLTRLNQLKSAIPNVLLLIAPRHPERFKAVFELSKRLGFNTRLRSAPTTIGPENDVIVLDSMGELLGFYQMSDYAFVGGSLISIGGHNVLEPIAMHIPVFCGPYMQNSKRICADLCAANALILASDADGLIQSIIEMHQNPAQRALQVANATAVLEANRGSVARHMAKIEAAFVG